MLKSILSSTSAAALLVCDEHGKYRSAQADEILQAAQHILAAQLNGREVIGCPTVAAEFLRMRLGTHEHEVFAVLLLDTKHRVIDYLELFRGSISQTSVYPRELIKESLARNAAAAILIHNHPSGVATPSSADMSLTQTLKSAFSLVDIRVLDHFVVTSSEVFSFYEHGLL